MTTSFYPPHHIGGDAIHVKYLAEELVKRGHEVHVLYSMDAYRVKIKRRKSKEKQNLHRDGVYIHIIKTPFNISAYESYIIGASQYVARKFENLIKEVKTDIVHHHNISLLGFDIFRKRGDYLNIYTAHDYWLICQQNNLLRYGKILCNRASFLSCTFCALTLKKPLQLWRYTKWYKNTIKDIDVVIAPSIYLKNRIVKKLDVKAVVIPNFAPTPPSPIPSSSFEDFYLYAGVLEPHKGVMELVKAFKDASSRINSKLIIVGEGSLKLKLQAYVNKHGLENKVLILGYVRHDQLYSLLKDAKAVIIPSKCPENCPLIALEALSVGTPIIVSNYGGLPEIARKIDKKLIFNTFEELITIMIEFDKSKYSPSRIESIYKLYYSPNAYLNKYLGFINNMLKE